MIAPDDVVKTLESDFSERVGEEETLSLRKIYKSWIS